MNVGERPLIHSQEVINDSLQELPAYCHRPAGRFRLDDSRLCLFIFYIRPLTCTSSAVQSAKRLTYTDPNSVSRFLSGRGNFGRFVPRCQSFRRQHPYCQTGFWHGGHVHWTTISQSSTHATRAEHAQSISSTGRRFRIHLGYPRTHCDESSRHQGRQYHRGDLCRQHSGGSRARRNRSSQRYSHP